MAKAELLFVELFHSLLSLDDKLNIAQSEITYFEFMSKDRKRPRAIASKNKAIKIFLYKLLNNKG